MATSPLPQIHISFAPPPEPSPEPYSPFTPLIVDDRDSFRPMLLSPPPSFHLRSPLRPVSSSQTTGNGLDRSRFEALLKASRERNGKRGPDLRKEVAVKAHKSKQAERRALFLSKVEAPPSPTATSTPKTPPESPAVFHYSLPSPGLVSPLALFESLGIDASDALDDGMAPRRAWVEQVDFRVPKKAPAPSPLTPRAPSNRHKALPSLEQITAHVNAHSQVSQLPRSPIPLPAFLQTNRSPSPPSKAVAVERPMLSVGTQGRLQLPIRRQSIPAAPAPAAPAPALRIAAPIPCSPLSPQPPTLQITTTLIPRTSSTSPVQLTAANLLALDSRARTAQDMLSTLRRRTPRLGVSSGSVDGNVGRGEAAAKTEDPRKGRRISAPAELPAKERVGFAHPVLNMPGGF